MGELIQEELACLLLKGLKDPRVKSLVITGVDMSPDLRNARIFFTIMGGSQRREDALKGLKSASGFIRKHLSMELRLKVTPMLDFRYDSSIEEGARIDALLDKIKAEEETNE